VGRIKTHYGSFDRLDPSHYEHGSGLTTQTDPHIQSKVIRRGRDYGLHHSHWWEVDDSRGGCLLIRTIVVGKHVVLTVSCDTAAAYLVMQIPIDLPRNTRLEVEVTQSLADLRAARTCRNSTSVHQLSPLDTM
jgi:hypothetical protein